MFHENRKHTRTYLDKADEAANLIHEAAPTWTLCTGFLILGNQREQLADVLLLNDSLSEDGAGEWGVFVRTGIQYPWRQIDSVTFGWMDRDRALACLKRIQAEGLAWETISDYQPTFHDHGRQDACRFCA